MTNSTECSRLVLEILEINSSVEGGVTNVGYVAYDIFIVFEYCSNF